MPDRFTAKALIALALTLLLAACGSGAGTGGVKTASSRPVTSNPRSQVRPPISRPPPSALVQVAPGLEGVIGATSDALARQFGTPRLEVWEGDARKLQFVGSACVLDVYLYPPSTGREPQATYVDARRASDGADVDRAACVAALKVR